MARQRGVGPISTAVAGAQVVCVCVRKCACVVMLARGCQASEVPLLSLCLDMSPFSSLDPITVDV